MMVFYLLSIGLRYLLIYGSRLRSSLGLGRSLGIVAFEIQWELLSSESRIPYLLDLNLSMSDVFEWIGDDVVDGVVEGFDFDINEGGFTMFLILVHLS